MATVSSLLFEDGKAKFYVNDHAMSSALNLPSGKTFNLEIESSLKKSGTIAAGDYTGFYVIIVSPY